MKKVLIYNWAHEPSINEFLKGKNIEHNSFKKFDSVTEFYVLVNEITLEGYDVMISDKGDHKTLMIDTHKFRQR